MNLPLTPPKEGRYVASFCRFAPSLCQLKLFGLRHSSGAINRSLSQSKILNLRRSQARLDSWTSLIALGRLPEQEPTLSMKQRCHTLQGHKQKKQSNRTLLFVTGLTDSLSGDIVFFMFIALGIGASPIG